MLVSLLQLRLGKEVPPGFVRRVRARDAEGLRGGSAVWSREVLGVSQVFTQTAHYHSQA